MINVNIWDDYIDDESKALEEPQKTFAYVEDTLSDAECKEVLEILQAAMAQISDCKLEVALYDSAKVYPKLVGTEMECHLYKRWQLQIENLSHANREEIVEKLQGELKYQGMPLNIYSES